MQRKNELGGESGDISGLMQAESYISLAADDVLQGSTFCRGGDVRW